jgi:hypothetical protein
MGLGTIMRKAATVAKQAIAAAAAVQRDDASGPLPLRCCLMSLSLPWDTLAHDLLYKVLTAAVKYWLDPQMKIQSLLSFWPFSGNFLI